MLFTGAGVRAQQDPTRLPSPSAGPGPGPGMMVLHGKSYYPPLPTLDFTATNEVIEPGLRSFSLDGNGHIKGGDELDIYADHVSGDLQLGLLDATGNVRIREFDTTITAKAVHFDAEHHSALITDGVIFRPPYALTASVATLNGNVIEAHNATITNTAPGTPRVFWLRANSLRLDQSAENVIMHGAGLYIGRTRLFELRKLKRTYRPEDENGLNDALKQRVGYDSSDGPFLGLTGGMRLLGLPLTLHTVVSERGFRSTGVSTDVTLIGNPNPKQKVLPPADSAMRLLRQISAPIGLPIPLSDPLHFHDFVSSDPFNVIGAQPLTRPLVTAGIAAIYHDRLLGRRAGTLLVSRFPEGYVSAMFPLGRFRPNLPTMSDPAGFREVLRHPDFVARVIGQYGYYKESPSNASGVRKAVLGSVESRPMLIGKNTLLHPVVDFTTNSYQGKLESYHYVQGNIAIEHVFSDRSMIGAAYIKSFQSGKSPFIFDTLDTTDEADFSAQYGNHRIVLGGRIQYDLSKHNVFDYQFMVGPDMGSFVPTIGYDKRSQSVNIGFSLSGIDF